MLLLSGGILKTIIKIMNSNVYIQLKYHRIVSHFKIPTSIPTELCYVIGIGGIDKPRPASRQLNCITLWIWIDARYVQDIVLVRYNVQFLLLLKKE